MYRWMLDKILENETVIECAMESAELGGQVLKSVELGQLDDGVAQAYRESIEVYYGQIGRTLVALAEAQDESGVDVVTDDVTDQELQDAIADKPAEEELQDDIVNDPEAVVCTGGCGKVRPNPYDRKEWRYRRCVECCQRIDREKYAERSEHDRTTVRQMARAANDRTCIKCGADELHLKKDTVDGVEVRVCQVCGKDNYV